jgi:hypothetical protein
MESILIPLGFFAAIPTTVWAVTAYRFKRQKESVKLLTAMTDKGQEVTPEIIKTLGIQQRPKHSDLRTGLVLLAIGLALLLSGGAIPDKDGQAAFAAFSTFPILIGLVFIGLWGFITRKPDA